MHRSPPGAPTAALCDRSPGRRPRGGTSHPGPGDGRELCVRAGGCRSGRRRLRACRRRRFAVLRRYVLVWRGAARRGHRRAERPCDGACSARGTGREPRASAACRGKAHRAGSHQQHQSYSCNRLARARPDDGGRRGNRRRWDGLHAMTNAERSPYGDARAPWSAEELERQLRALGEARYHNHHPFNQRMHKGELSRAELQLWVANRFCYQQAIPLKDAAILSNCPEQAVRRAWIQRIIDHDGREGSEGGLEAWLRLAAAMGVARDVVLSETWVLPGVRFAVDAYVQFCRTRPWLEAVAASLTELFAPTIVSERLSAILTHYKWIEPEGL